MCALVFPNHYMIDIAGNPLQYVDMVAPVSPEIILLSKAVYGYSSDTTQYLKTPLTA